MALDGDEKALIMASAVLGTILLTLVIFSALSVAKVSTASTLTITQFATRIARYKSFISEYSATYNRQMALVQRSLGPYNNDHRESQPIVPASPTFTHVTSDPSPTSVGEAPAPAPVAAPEPEPEPEPPVIAKPLRVTIQAPNDPPPAPAPEPEPEPLVAETSVWGTTEQTTKSNDWASEDAGNEFFSADEQARIWQELREAEEKAAKGGPTAADQAASRAQEAKQSVEADEDTTFGFGDDAEGDTEPAKNDTNADYIAPDSLLPTGEVFDPSVGGNVVAKTQTIKQATSASNDAAEWWN